MLATMGIVFFVSMALGVPIAFCLGIKIGRAHV